MSDCTINLDLATIRKYWLSLSALGAGAWLQLNPDQQQQIIHYVGTAVHGHPHLSFWFGLAVIILADLKQSPRTPVGKQ